MARLQLLRLPEKTVGDATETPFVLVFDDMADDEFDRFITSGRRPLACERIGAADIMAFNFPVEVVQ